MKIKKEREKGIRNKEGKDEEREEGREGGARWKQIKGVLSVILLRGVQPKMSCIILLDIQTFLYWYIFSINRKC